MEATVNPFPAGDPPRRTSDIHWVRPELVAHVVFAEFSTAGKLRQAGFKAPRKDKTGPTIWELQGRSPSS
jgi:bifunctional non-homologous end joining protein LigD